MLFSLMELEMGICLRICVEVGFHPEPISTCFQRHRTIAG